MNLLFLLKPKNTVDFLNGEDTVRAGLLKLRASGYTAAPGIVRRRKIYRDGHRGRLFVASA